MIAHLRGEVVRRDSDTVVVDVKGVGYLVHVADIGAVPARGQPVELHTSTQVREDALDLYGFTDPEALALFERLMAASGVGPKLALAALRTHRPVVLRRAITAGDLETLKAVPGIGDKSAQRLVLELGEKLAVPEPGGTAPGGDGGPDSPLGEVREALLALGYTAGEAQTAVAELHPDGDDVSALVRRALERLGAASAGGR